VRKGGGNLDVEGIGKKYGTKGVKKRRKGKRNDDGTGKLKE
jgi:hypothetical protein